MPHQTCTSVYEPYCPLEDTIYGYYPSLPASIFFIAFFSLCSMLQLGLGIRYKTWTYMVGAGIGSLLEAAGYVGRLQLHDNPFSGWGLDLQICALIIAPAFISASIYIILKHLVLAIGPEFSRLPAKYYTYLFIFCDLLSLVLQGAGGGLAATAKTKSNETLGNNFIMAGIVWQVVTLFAFGSLTGLYLFNVRHRYSEIDPVKTSFTHTLRFKLFAGAITLAFLAIFTRCVYRIAEMAGGWRSPIMRNEGDFVALDGAMVALATLALTVFHPGWCFPQIHDKASAAYKDGTPRTGMRSRGNTDTELMLKKQRGEIKVVGPAWQ